MPLNLDPNAIPDDEYWADWQAAREAQETAGEPVCALAPPADVIARIEAELDAQ